MGSLEIRLTAPPPNRRQLAELGLDDASIALVRAAAKHQSELGRRLASDRGLAERFVTDPAATLAAVGVPRATIDAVPVTPASKLSNHIQNVLIRVLDERHPRKPSPTAAVDLLAATFAAANGDPVKQAELRTSPRNQVKAAARAHPPAGIAPDSAALESLVNEVTDAILRAATGAPGASGGGTSEPTPDGWVVGPAASSVVDIPIAGR